MCMVTTFGELIAFSVGTNMSRLSTGVSDSTIYTLEDFDSDLGYIDECASISEQLVPKGKNAIATSGDVLISVTRNQAGIVSSKNTGKFLNSNFIKCEFDEEKLYPWYFCYLFNESTSISRQIKKLQQGTIGCINRLTVSMIGSLEFELVDIKKQKNIGDLYRNMLVREQLTLKQMEDMKKYTLEIIRIVDNN